MADDADVLDADGVKKRALRVMLHPTEVGGTRADVFSMPPSLTPLGVAQDTTISAASGLPTVSGSIPAATTVALIQVTGQNCRWRDDGTDPTASVGIQLGAGTSFWYRGTFSAFKIIEEAASAVLNVAYYQEVAE